MLANVGAFRGPCTLHSPRSGVDPRAGKWELVANLCIYSCGEWFATVKLVGKARGVLAFPSVVLTVAQERDGEGALRVANTMERYYRLSLPATGAPTDAASSTIIYLFMTEDALNKFRASDVWTVGAGAVTPKLTSDGGIDVRATGGPILAFVLNGDNSVATHALQGARIAPLFS